MKLIIMFFVLTVISFSQIKVSWDIDQTGNTLWYNVYYCAGADTSIFPLKDGVTHEQVWDWQTGSTLYPYFYVKQPYVGLYYRVGIIGVGADGEKSTMSVKTYKVTKPPKVDNVRTTQIRD